jgi:FkbM family methyltransferase
MPKLSHHLFKSMLSRYPLLSGRGTLLQYPPLRGLRFNEEVLRVVLPNGHIVFVDPNDFIGRLVYYFGDVDPKVTKTLALLLGRGETLIDVGANVGVIALQALPFVGEQGRIVAFEPQPTCCELFRRTLSYNQIANVELHQFALSDKNGEGFLYSPDAGNSGMAAINISSSGGEDRRRISLKNGAEVLGGLAIDEEYTLKIDVEGHETSVIRGLLPYLRERPPKGIVFESNIAYEKMSLHDSEIYQILSGLDFVILRIEKTAFNLRYSVVGPESSRATDFVAVRRDLAGLFAQPE